MVAAGSKRGTFVEDDIHHNAGEADVLLDVARHLRLKLPPAQARPPLR